ncbi:MAG TPA: class I fructose-bisphosphate aldolase [Candidatus Saccharimonadales bacterium]|nr:class I fructose-bisphosphate aldolase [Candidatus Saccharimonadales bacterium]
MEETIKKLLADGRGLLAADESTHTIEKRFAALGLTSTPELNKKYREMLFTAPGIENYISGVILFDETVRQNLQKILEEKGIVPGIKVDGGLEPFDNSEEQITKVPENLEGKLGEYFGMGMRFTKWRAAIKISDIFPTDSFLEEDLDRMVRFAGISQEKGFIPLVEPEVLLDGNHTTTRCAEISVKVWQILFEKLNAANIDLKNLILKTNMVLPGKDSGIKAAPLEVAEATLRSLRKSVPPDMGGIVFLSGGQTPDEATNNLNEIVKRRGDAPWPISFSFSRALQEETMKEWLGKDENVGPAQKTFLNRLIMVSKARNGQL